MLSPDIDPDVDLNSDQYDRLVGQNITELLDTSNFLLGKEADEQVR